MFIRKTDIGENMQTRKAFMQTYAFTLMVINPPFSSEIELVLQFTQLNIVKIMQGPILVGAQ